MKKLFYLFMAALGLLAFAGCSLTPGVGGEVDVRTTAALAGIAAYEIGYSVGLEDPEIDRGIRNAYKLAKTGELDQGGMNQITDLISKKVSGRPTLPRNIVSLLKLVGVQFDPLSGAAIGLDKIPTEVFEAVEAGYIAGIQLAARQKAGELSEADVEQIFDWINREVARIERRLEGRAL